MKSYIYFLLGLVAYSLSSCNNSDETDSHAPTNSSESKQALYFKVKLKDEFIDIHSRGIDKSKMPTLKHLTIYFFECQQVNDKRQVKLVNYLQLDESNIEMRDHSAVAQSKIEIENGKYLVAIVANGPQHWKDDLWNLSNSEISNIIPKGLIKHSLVNFNDPANNPYKEMMVSANNPTLLGTDTFNQQLLRGDGSSYITFENNTASNPAEVSVYLDRYVSAIQVSEHPDGIHAKHGLSMGPNMNLKLGGFVVLNLPTQGYAIEQLQESSQSKYKLQHIFTPYLFYSEIKDSWLHTLDTYAKIETPDQGSSHVVGYAHEGVSSMFDLKCKILVENNTALKYQWGVSEFPSDNPEETTAYHGYTTGLILQFKNDKPFYCYKNDYKMYVLESYDTPEPQAITKNKIINIYPEGVMYLTYYIKNPLIQDSFQVERNTWYNITLVSISQPGSPYPGGDIPDPAKKDFKINRDDPIGGPENSPLNSNITIEKWHEKTVEIDF